MASIKDVFQSGDWKTEKHVPAITAPDIVEKGAVISVTVGIGKEIAHPNTSEHHISWIELYFKPDGAKFAVEIGRYEFNAHGAAVEGPNTSTIYSVPEVVAKFKTEKSGTLYATSYCNIHGLWESAKMVAVK